MLETLQNLLNNPESRPPGEPHGPLRRTAFIDVGSNSFRLVVISYVPGYHFQVTDEVRESVRLVHNLGATGHLSQEAQDHAVEVMRLYASFCKASEITDIVAVATSAVREAKNREEFLTRVAAETGITVRLLSGTEEAYYGYLAAVNSTLLHHGFVFDLGGGSLEITRVINRRSYEAVSLTLGAVRMTEEWLAEAPTSKEASNRFRRFLRDQLAPLDWFRGGQGMRLIGQGGSLRNAARLIQKRQGYPLDELHGYRFTASDLHKLIKQMEPLSIGERRSLPGMKPDRADITLAGAIVIEECMRQVGSEELTVSGQGLREGLFYERFLNEYKPPLFTDVRKASVMNIAHLYRYQAKHAEHVAHLALSMYDQLSVSRMDGAFADSADRELLWAACMLHDIGMTIDYNDHHRHSFYLILNSGLPGYTHRELALIALAARYHRKGMPSADELTGVLADGDFRRLLQMTALLRLAEQLDRSRDGSVEQIRLRDVGGSYRLEVLSEADISVALWSAALHVDIFAAAFGKPLIIAQQA